MLLSTCTVSGVHRPALSLGCLTMCPAVIVSLSAVVAVLPSLGVSGTSASERGTSFIWSSGFYGTQSSPPVPHCSPYTLMQIPGVPDILIVMIPDT